MEKFEKVSAVKGMNDILPGESARWERFEQAVRQLFAAYGYRNLRTPVLEHTRLFTRGIGEVTDIVEKEMYTFTDALNGDQLTLRPEFTAGIVRATVEHNLIYNGPQRVYAMGPVFRHERPQRGRYRQFHQIDVEALGFAGPDVDAELIFMLRRLWQTLGLSDVRLELNSLGQPEERARHREALIAYFERYKADLDEDGQRRLYTNPLRILDTKNPALQEIANQAPHLSAHLGPESRAHFDGLQQYLQDAGIAYTVNPRMVRGLDYYNLTVFEWITDRLGAQGTVCGGGRYDGLIGLLGGKPAPAVGFGAGVERILDLMGQTAGDADGAACDVYVVHQGSEAARLGFRVAENLRDAGLDVVLHGGEGGFKSQMKKADASGAEYALILGEDEVRAGEASVKPLRQPGEQTRVGLDDLAGFLVDRLTTHNEE
jgi:histidyl-tRNA synthetase